MRQAAFEDQVLQLEGALGGIGDSRCKSGIGFRTALNLGEIELAHPPHMTEMMRSVGYRSDVGDDQTLDRGAMLERRDHRHLAAHAVSEQGKAFVAPPLQRR